MTAKRYLVTGGAGFIGSHLTGHLLEQGYAVTVLDNFAAGKRENLAGMRGDLQIVEGSVTNADDVGRAAQGVAGVFHLAAVPSVARSVDAPVESHEQNTTGTVQVLDVARRRGLRVVYAGSSSAYGEDATPAKHEKLREDPMSPYAASKLAGELYCRAFSRVYGLPVFVTRFFNVFGPRQEPNSQYSGVVAAFCLALLNAHKGVRPRIDGDGTQSRDFTYVADVARGCRLAMECGHTGFQVANLACGRRHTLLELLENLMTVSGVKVEPTFSPARAGDIRHSMADISQAKQLLGFAPEVAFAEGLRRTFDWYRRTYS